MRRWAAGLVVFVSAGAVLVLEILAGRLLAPYVGVSLATFTGIIGVVLAGIATGTWSGGFLADRHPPLPLLAGALLLGGASAIAAVPLVHWFGQAAADDDSTAAIVVLAGVGFFVPSALLSAVMPIVVKQQLASVRNTGAVVGFFSALGTAGSLTGVFATGFVLVGAFPTTPIIVTLGGVLIVIGLAVWLRRGRPLPVVAVLAAVGLGAASSTAALVVDGPCQRETAYFCARVETDPLDASRRILWLDTLQHSLVDVDDPEYLGHSYAQTLSDVVDTFAPAREAVDAVHVGGGGFVLPRYLAATRPGSRNVVLELDEDVVALAESQLGLERSADLVAITGDARVNLRDLPTASADLVIGDAFGGRAVPWHLTTREFLDDVHRVLRPGGTYVANLIDHPPLGFVRAELATLQAVFGHVALSGPAERVEGTFGGNFIVTASDEPVNAAAIEAHSQARGDPELTLVDADLLFLVGEADVLTDEHAPVDQLLIQGP